MRVRVPEHVTMQVLHGEAVLLDLRNGHYFGLDDVGTRMFEVLSEADSIGAACRRLLEEFEVETERLERDLRELLARLAEHELIELQEP